MIRTIVEMLNYTDYYGVSERVDIAKGKYEVPTTWAKVKNHLKRHLQWRRK